MKQNWSHKLTSPKIQAYRFYTGCQTGIRQLHLARGSKFFVIIDTTILKQLKHGITELLVKICRDIIRD